MFEEREACCWHSVCCVVTGETAFTERMRRSIHWCLVEGHHRPVSSVVVFVMQICDTSSRGLDAQLYRSSAGINNSSVPLTPSGRPVCRHLPLTCVPREVWLVVGSARMTLLSVCTDVPWRVLGDGRYRNPVDATVNVLSSLTLANAVGSAVYTVVSRHDAWCYCVSVRDVSVRLTYTALSHVIPLCHDQPKHTPFSYSGIAVTDNRH